MRGVPKRVMEEGGFIAQTSPSSSCLRCFEHPSRLKPDCRHDVAVLRPASLEDAGEVLRLNHIFHAFAIAAADVISEPRPRLFPQLLPVPLVLPELKLTL